MVVIISKSALCCRPQWVKWRVCVIAELWAQVEEFASRAWGIMSILVDKDDLDVFLQLNVAKIRWNFLSNWNSTRRQIKGVIADNFFRFKRNISQMLWQISRIWKRKIIKLLFKKKIKALALPCNIHFRLPVLPFYQGWALCSFPFRTLRSFAF